MSLSVGKMDVKTGDGEETSNLSRDSTNFVGNQPSETTSHTPGQVEVEDLDVTTTASNSQHVR